MQKPGIPFIFVLFMKKLLASISVICYLVMSSGVVVNFHYCMNRLASVKLFQAETKVCGLCGMKKHKSHGCCHDEIKVVKMEDDQNKANHIVASFEAPEQTVAEVSDFIIAPFTSEKQANYYENHSPPLLSVQDTHLQNCVFRI